ncbi:GNAT family N-acetyltransferase [Paraburkholderia dinghuensis]|uniref:N-acetyltransferase n=1 Tax=Paraburkholderia dinghuensis TaxID=2305225 RepID=A0A3N6P4B0_9BURK|nr:GNAT family N-acetyltransferase [Paraburkholderia dinghuensis]RQH08493.1 N-acetyltransferase [Paraburkholderia dinghuensis]
MIDVIESPRLLLAPFSPADADEAYPCMTPSLTRYMVSEPPASPDEFAASWRAWIEACADGTEWVFTVREKMNNRFLGLAGLGRIQTPNPELGIWIRESRQGNGFGREAVTCLYLWAGANFDCSCFIYPVAEDNYFSRRIAESLGGVVTNSGATPKYRYVVYSIPRYRPVPDASFANATTRSTCEPQPGAIGL